MSPAFGSPVKKTAISGQERFLSRWDLRLQRDTQRPNRAAPRSPRNAAGRRQPDTTVFRPRATALVGAIRQSLRHVPPVSLRGLSTQLASANGPPLHVVFQWPSQPWTCSWSAPSGRHCTLCPGRFRGMHT
eukprot:jgi/Tetstr1/432218/TSEL_021674.t1